MNYFCITVRWLDDRYHGQNGNGEPEWPPSPLRLFQALLAAAASHWRTIQFEEWVRPALTWLEKQHTQPDAISGQPRHWPDIVAPTGKSGQPFVRFVPNNDSDKKLDRQHRLTAKSVRPTFLSERSPIHYLYPVADTGEFAKHKQTLIDAARSVTHLGWGVDMVAGNASEMSAEEAAELPGERWQPTKDGAGTPLRVPREGTLKALMDKHTKFLNRLSNDGFRPVPPLTAFNVVGYRRDTELGPRPFAAFELQKPIQELAELPSGRSKFRPFDPTRRAVTVAGMVRNATGVAARQSGHADDWIATFVHGHTADGQDRATGDQADQRFAYLPLPSIERRAERGLHVGMIRRVLVVGPPDGADHVNWVRRALSGQELIEETKSEPVAMLTAIPNADRRLEGYVGPSRVWSTVTPVVLPGYDDPEHRRRQLRDISDSAEQRRLLSELEERMRGFLMNAFRQAGFADDLVNQLQLQWRNVGFWPGVDLATRYTRSDHHRRFSVYHVRVVFPSAVRGPLAVGAGRYRGLGLFAAEHE